MSENYSAKPRSLLDIMTKRIEEPYPEGMSTELAFYSQDDDALVREHIKHYFGKAIKQEGINHPAVQGQIKVLFITPNKQRPYLTLVTHGLGACRMQVPSKFAAKQYERAELVLYLPSHWKIAIKDWQANPDWYWPIKVLIDFAFRPTIEKRWWGPTPFIDYTHPLARNTELKSVVALPPDASVLESHVCSLSGGEQVNFYRLLPLYGLELAYGLMFGWLKFIEVWQRKFKFSFKTKIHRPWVLTDAELTAINQNHNDPKTIVNTACIDFASTLPTFANCYTLEQYLAVKGHIKHYFGSAFNTLDVHKALDVSPVSIDLIAPTKQRPFYTLATIGLGVRRQYAPNSMEQLDLERVELVLFLPPDWKLDEDHINDQYWGWPVRVLFALISEAQENEFPFMVGGLIDISDLLNVPDYSTVMLFTADSEPNYIEAGADSCFFANAERVNFLAVVPLSKRELQCISKMGSSDYYDQRIKSDLFFNPRYLMQRMCDGAQRKHGGARHKKGAPRKGEGAPRKGEGAPRKGEGASRKGDGALRKSEGASRKGEGALRKSEGAPRKAGAKPPFTRKHRNQ